MHLIWLLMAETDLLLNDLLHELFLNAEVVAVGKGGSIHYIYIYTVG